MLIDAEFLKRYGKKKLMPPRDGLPYRPEIDGLRAIAVLAVVLFHADLGAPGGYVGVDVFFVVSGFLITSLILTDLQKRCFSISGFWERRLRRVLPALLAVVLATLIAGWFLSLPADYAELGTAASYQAVFAANFFFWSKTGYFGGPAGEMPLLHTWSLAVEEQFYFLMPLILLLFSRVPALRRSRLSFAIAIALGVSLALSCYGVQNHPSASFYLLPTRAWELLLGSLVALLPLVKAGPFWSEAACFGGLLCVLVPCFLYDSETSFPGITAIPPCFGTALFIWFSRPAGPREAIPTMARVLSTKSVVFIGLISYSLYLWHWPIFVLSKYFFLGPLTKLHRVALTVFSVACAVLSWRCVEVPFRRRKVCATRNAMLSFGGISLATVLVLGRLIFKHDGFVNRVSPDVLSAAAAQEDVAYVHEMRPHDVETENLLPLGVDDPSRPIWGLVWGDSHAMGAMPAFDEFITRNGLVGRQVTHSATPPLVGFYRKSKHGLKADSLVFSDAVLDYVKTHKVRNVFLIANWSFYSTRGSGDLDQAVINTVTKLAQAGAQPWIMLQIPSHPVNIPRLLAHARWRHFDYQPFLGRRSSFNGLHGSDSVLIDKIIATGGRVLDPRPLFLDRAGLLYLAEKNGIVLYRDSHHLTCKGAKLILAPLLDQTGVPITSQTDNEIRSGSVQCANEQNR